MLASSPVQFMTNQTVRLAFNFTHPKTKQMIACSSFDDMKKRMIDAGLDRIPAVQRILRLQYSDDMDPKLFLAALSRQAKTTTVRRDLNTVKTTPIRLTEVKKKRRACKK